jgi:5'-deoxynucleotidase YfbR-like HD superfamily hydrolase
MLIKEFQSKEDIKSVVREVIQRTLSEDELNKFCGKIEAILSWKFSIQEWFENLDTWIYKLKRFSPHAPMFYRDFVWIHLVRMWLIWPCLQYIIQYGDEKLWLRDKCKNPREGFDFRYFLTMLERHDDSEIFSPLWDIPSHIKYNLSEKSKQILEQIEISIEECLSKNYQSVEYYNQEEKMKGLFIDARQKITLEAQVMSYLDKVDGFMMAFHEVAAGNATFIVPLQNYIQILKDIQSWEKLPLISLFFSIFFADYREFLSEIHNPSEQEEFHLYGWLEQFWHIFDIQSLISTETKLPRLIETEKHHTLKSLLEDDFWLPGYLSWKRWILRDKSYGHKIWEKEMRLSEHLTTKVEG